MVTYECYRNPEVRSFYKYTDSGPGNSDTDPYSCPDGSTYRSSYSCPDSRTYCGSNCYAGKSDSGSG